MQAALARCECQMETEEQKYERVSRIIEEYQGKEGNLIQILHMAQGIFGCLPFELQQFIALKLEMPFSEVNGVVTFYSFFTTEPRGENVIRVCMGTACYVRGGKKIIEKIQEILGVKVGGTTKDQKFTLEVMRCIGACGLAPALTVNDQVYKRINPDKLQSIIEKYY